MISDIVIYSPDDHTVEPEERAMVELLEAIRWDPVLAATALEDAVRYVRSDPGADFGYRADVERLFNLARRAQDG